MSAAALHRLESRRSSQPVGHMEVVAGSAHNSAPRGSGAVGTCWTGTDSEPGLGVAGDLGSAMRILPEKEAGHTATWWNTS